MKIMDEQPPGLQHGAPLAPLTTLELGGTARHLVAAEDEETVTSALHWAGECGLPVVILGGGSNVVVADAGFDGLVIQIGLRGIDLQRHGDTMRVTAGAGEVWDELVKMTVAEGWAGIECLSGIPGTAGATPIQNVGAYGQEVSGTLHSVRVLDRQSLTIINIPAGDCRLGYRSSRFRLEPERYVVLAVTLDLSISGTPATSYPELSRLVAAGAGQPSVATLREAVLELRRSKSMVVDEQDANHRSAGSFFVNPVIEADELQALYQRALAAGLLGAGDEVPHYLTESGKVKVPAAWLIEAAGFRRGFRRGEVGLSSRHVLALVHHGGGSTRQLVELAEEIQTTVQDRLGLLLQPEPVYLGSDYPVLWSRKRSVV
jgi:UDP-N-acetylmuramate dehydrogenase